MCVYMQLRKQCAFLVATKIALRLVSWITYDHLNVCYCVCMYIYMCVCVCVCVCVYIYIYI